MYLYKNYHKETQLQCFLTHLNTTEQYSHVQIPEVSVLLVWSISIHITQAHAGQVISQSSVQRLLRSAILNSKARYPKKLTDVSANKKKKMDTRVYLSIKQEEIVSDGL